MVFLKNFAISGLNVPTLLNVKTTSGLEKYFLQNGIISDEIILYCNKNKVDMHKNDVRFDNDDVITLTLPVLGGKGGFGSMLRALGAQIEKTTNKEACRDLSGRRLRDINEEDRLKKYVEKQFEREQEAKEKKAAKLEKLKRLANGENKHEFHDPKYDAEREVATERVHEAMEQALSNKTKNVNQPSTSGIGQKRKLEQNNGSSGTKKTAKGAVFLGVDITDSDLDSTDSEED